MIGEQDSHSEGYKNVSCKVPTWVAELLNIICKSRDTDIYHLLQLTIEFLIETAKVSGPVPPQMQTLINMLKMDASWNKAFNFASTSAQLDVAQVILVLQQHEGGEPRNGFGLAMIDKPFLPGETPQMTLNVDEIMERVIEVSMHNVYDSLRKLSRLKEYQSIRETLTCLADAEFLHELSEQDEAEYPQLGNFHDFGRVIEYGNKTKRAKHRTPDSLANSKQPLIFADFDRETGADSDTIDDASPMGDVKPFGVEP